jgi:ankyrin repeat protein
MVRIAYALIAISLQGCDSIREITGGALEIAVGTHVEIFDSTPLCDAIISGNVDHAMQLVEQGKDVNAGSGCALLRAAERDQLKLVKQLLDHGADPNRYISAELTPLKGAVMSRDVQVVRTLLEKGANPRDDFYAFEVVLNFGDVEMAELFLRYGTNANMTFPAKEDVYAFPGEQMVTVPRSDLKPDRIDNTVKRLQCTLSELSEGTSLLHLALAGVPESRERIAKLLIERGADPNARTLNGTTPLMYAARQHNQAVMTMLMDAGADAKAMDRCGRTAEDYAALNLRH